MTAVLGLALFGGWGAFDAMSTPIDWREFGGELEDNRPWGWGLIGFAVLFFVVVSVYSLRQKRAFESEASRHTQLVQRLIPMWARIDSSVLGERISKYNEGIDVLLGHVVTLQLTLCPSPDHTSSYRTIAEPQHLSWRGRFEPHVCAALAPGAWLEIAYDPVERIIVPQQLVTRDGATLPTVPVQ